MRFSAFSKGERICLREYYDALPIKEFVAGCREAQRGFTVIVQAKGRGGGDGGTR